MIWRAHSSEQVAAGALTFCAVLLSTVHIFMHLRWNRTKLWRCTCRILAIVPIYSLDAWGCLMLEANDFGWAELLTLLREVYESMAIVSFMQFILTFLHGPKHLAQELEKKHPEPFQHPIVLRWFLPKYRPGAHFVACVVLGILQYIPVMLLIFVVNFGFWILSEQDVQLEWLMRLTLIPKLLKAGSCALAMYHLALFYHKVHDELGTIRPVLKFMGIKGIVFFTFWQELFIAIFVKVNVIPPSERNKQDHLWGQMQIADGIKNLLLCGEMLVFAELHRRAYPYNPYEELEEEHGHQGQLLRSSSLDRLGTPRVDHRMSRIHSPTDLLDLYKEVMDLLREARSEDLEMRLHDRGRDGEEASHDDSSTDVEEDVVLDELDLAAARRAKQRQGGQQATESTVSRVASASSVNSVRSVRSVNSASSGEVDNSAAPTCSWQTVVNA